MGIQSLLPSLKSITRTIHVGDAYSGKRVAIDSYCWLHRGAYSCSTELVEGIPTEKWVGCFFSAVTKPFLIWRPLPHSPLRPQRTLQVCHLLPETRKDAETGWCYCGVRLWRRRDAWQGGWGGRSEKV